MAKIRLLLSFIVLAAFTASPCIGAESNSAAMAKIEQMIKSHDGAFNNKDIDAVMGFYSPTAVLMGTGPGERYEGTEEIREAHVKFFESYDKETSENGLPAD